MATSVRRERMYFRVSAEDKTLLRAAAELKNQDMTDFVLSIARQTAKQIIADQRDFVLPQEEFESFLAALDRAPVEKPRLRRLFEEPSVLEEDGENRVAFKD